MYSFSRWIFSFVRSICFRVHFLFFIMCALINGNERFNVFFSFIISPHSFEIISISFDIMMMSMIKLVFVFCKTGWILWLVHSSYWLFFLGAFYEVRLKSCLLHRVELQGTRDITNAVLAPKRAYFLLKYDGRKLKWDCVLE